ncbi:EG45-like domain containing protein 2 [Prosopis cineraria]|uniref:EG45-like domain containing protein 2 n=1 Tax=Prosopis cineraria TaxID=364024 RepID=UPI00240FBAE4|nr:EG45-like domain containing protein 2 [Prosopis cineraria]
MTHHASVERMCNGYKLRPKCAIKQNQVLVTKFDTNTIPSPSSILGFEIMKLFGIAILLSSLLVQEASLVVGDVGTANSYGPPYLPTACDGSKREQFPPGNLFVAVSEGLWDNGAACGRRYRIRCVSGNNRPCKSDSVDVKVVDLCKKSPCPNTILLSKSAFATISRFHHADINIEYVEI